MLYTILIHNGDLLHGCVRKYDWSQNFVRVDRGSDLCESDLSKVCSAKHYPHHQDRGILSELGEDPTYPRFTVYI